MGDEPLYLCTIFDAEASDLYGIPTAPKMVNPFNPNPTARTVPLADEYRVIAPSPLPQSALPPPTRTGVPRL